MLLDLLLDLSVWFLPSVSINTALLCIPPTLIAHHMSPARSLPPPFPALFLLTPATHTWEG